MLDRVPASGATVEAVSGFSGFKVASGRIHRSEAQPETASNPSGAGRGFQGELEMRMA
jgi:hypothetical protein